MDVWGVLRLWVDRKNPLHTTSSHTNLAKDIVLLMARVQIWLLENNNSTPLHVKTSALPTCYVDPVYVWGNHNFALCLHFQSFFHLLFNPLSPCLRLCQFCMSPLLWCCSSSSLISLPNSITSDLVRLSYLTWHRWTSCLAAPHYSSSNDLNADRADVCLYSMPVRWPPVCSEVRPCPGAETKVNSCIKKRFTVL